MSLFSFLRKSKRDSASDDGAFYSRAEEDSKAVRSRGKRGKSGRSDQPAADPILPEKKRARRRLVGAVALVLAAVIGLPMLLDSEPKPLASDIAIQIPSRDEPAGNDNLHNSVASLQSGEELVEPPANPEPMPLPAAPEPAPDIAPVEAQPEQSPPVVKAAPSTPSSKQSTEPPVPKRANESARALALLEGRPDPAAQKKSEKYVIQVAALATKENVDELQAKLKAGGVRSFTEQISTAAGPRTRIRVGPFASRDEAEKMREKILKLGLNGSIVPA